MISISPTPTSDLALRRTLQPKDRERVREMVTASGFFNAEEIAIAVELVDDRLEKGEASDYSFLFADTQGQTVAYACFGKIPLTVASFDLYWIVVDPALKRYGIGRHVLAACEQEVQQQGGTRIYLDTSTRPQYIPTRAFYERCGYHLAACLDDFYAPGDGKAIYCKALFAAESLSTTAQVGMVGAAPKEL